MKAITQKLISEIDILLQMNESFMRKYTLHAHHIEPELMEEFLFFHNKAKFIGETLDRKDFLGLLKNFKFSHVNLTKSQIELIEPDLKVIVSHLRVFRRELEEGHIYKVSELIRAEVFNDFLEGAKYLLDEGWKDAAAVIIGGVLENHLRELCKANNLPIKDSKGKGLSIDPMNISLCKAGVYKLVIQKLITPYAGIRNDAAHGDWGNYTAKQVEDMYDFVADFKNQIA